MARKRTQENTFSDGVGSERCLFCFAELRAKNGKPRVSIDVEDAEELLSLLVDLSASKRLTDFPHIWSGMIQRFEHALGQTTAQVKSRLEARAYGKPE